MSWTSLHRRLRPNYIMYVEDARTEQRYLDEVSRLDVLYHRQTRQARCLAGAGCASRATRTSATCERGTTGRTTGRGTRAHPDEGKVALDSGSPNPRVQSVRHA